MNRTTSKLRTALLPLLAALVLAGCATSASVDPASIPAAPVAYKENAAAVTTAAATAPQSQGQLARDVAGDRHLLERLGEIRAALFLVAVLLHRHLLEVVDEHDRAVVARLHDESIDRVDVGEPARRPHERQTIGVGGDTVTCVGQARLV